MQNKGFVKVFAVLLTLVCLFYISFSFVASHHENVAKEQADGQHYLDSMKNEKVWLGHTLKECQELGIGLGLDLKGGMSVTMEISEPDVVLAYVSNKEKKEFKEAFEEARAATEKDGDFVKAFISKYNAKNAGKVAAVFDAQSLSSSTTKVESDSDDDKVEAALRERIREALDNSFNVLRSRIDRFGVVQPNMQIVEGGRSRILVELPGVTDKDRVKRLLEGSANLQFWVACNSAEISAWVSEFNKIDEEMAAVDSLATKYGNKPIMSRMQLVQNGGIVGVAASKDTAVINKAINLGYSNGLIAKEDVRFMWSVDAVEKNSSNYQLYALKVTKADGSAALEGDVIADAKAGYDKNGKPAVTMQMTPKASGEWAKITEENAGGFIAIVLDNCVYSAPGVKGKIAGGNSEITGNFTIEETQDLANVLRSGKFSAPMKIVDSYVVGPTLGEQSIKQGLISFVVAFVLLMVYMCVMYGVIPGSVANVALLLNLFFTLGILASFQAALTLSGIAGIVLTLGMAVDANVLIYERAKEELRGGKNVQLALSDGYKNAFSAIFDSNFTSIITGVILFNFGTGPIKGFATTLIIGLLCSFFTAVFVTRVIFEHFMSKNKWTNITFTTKFSSKMMTGTKYNFIKSSKMAGIVFGVLAIVMIGSFAVRGLRQSIDFTGGRNYVVKFENSVEPEQVRDLLKKEITEDNVQVIAIAGEEGKVVRISTNYMIADTAKLADENVEALLYKSFVSGGLVDSTKVDIATFRDVEVDKEKGSIISSQKVGPSIAADIRNGAIISVVLALIAIFVYILVRFRNVAYSVGSIVALGVDVLMIFGCYSLFAGVLPMTLEMDQTFIGAVLTAIGYSINDKVVVFDRIREFTGLYPKRDRYELFNISLNTTLARTINTSVSTLIVLLCIFILGGDSIRSFSFAMILGVVFGTLSSLFIAAPVALKCMRNKNK